MINQHLEGLSQTFGLKSHIWKQHLSLINKAGLQSLQSIGGSHIKLYTLVLIEPH